MSMTLKPEGWIQRENDRKIKKPVENPLSDAQKKQIETAWYDEKKKMTVKDYCVAAYKNRMLKSGLKSDSEEIGDLENDAYIFMRNILDKFDLSKCGPIAEYDVKGAKNPKSLAFYFRIYFANVRVQLLACEARTYKNQRNIGSNGQIFQEIIYDEEGSNSLDAQYEITDFINYELEKQDPMVKRMFKQQYEVGISQKELREEYGDKFNEYSNKIKKMLEIVNKNYRNDWILGQE